MSEFALIVNGFAVSLAFFMIAGLAGKLHKLIKSHNHLLDWASAADEFIRSKHPDYYQQHMKKKE